MYIYLCGAIYLHVVYRCIHICIHVHMFVFLYVHLFMHSWMYSYRSIHICIFIYITVILHSKFSSRRTFQYCERFLLQSRRGGWLLEFHKNSTCARLKFVRGLQKPESSCKILKGQPAAKLTISHDCRADF